jgi:phosphatidate phosphatase PAH1
LKSIGVPAGPVLTCPVDFRAILRAYMSHGFTKLKLVHLFYLRSMFPQTALHGAFGNTPQDAKVYKRAEVNKDNIFNVLKTGKVGTPEQKPKNSVVSYAKGAIAHLFKNK